MVKLEKIIRFGKQVTFYFTDSTKIEYVINDSRLGEVVFLETINEYLNNDEVFTKLGIEDPNKLYKSLGIYKYSGICPYCKREDLDVLFKYFEENYMDSEEEIEEVKSSNEFDWLFS